MSLATNERWNYIRTVANSIGDPELRAQRIYFAEEPFAFRGRSDADFDIRHRISRHFECDFLDVAFCGSAHLGFSPIKDTVFVPGKSDLDVAIIDHNLFQNVWRDLVRISR